jgi:hypothetical protein
LKRIIPVLLILVLLAGCAGSGNTMDRVAALRSGILAKGAEFDAAITADYGDKTYTFGMHCRLEKQGKLSFAVTAPDSISGITGQLSAEGGKLTFDDIALQYGLMADGLLSPVSAPWILLTTLRSGYITSGCTEEGMIRLSINDSYEQDALRLDIWLDAANRPACADILHNGRRILSVNVENFEIL